MHIVYTPLFVSNLAVATDFYIEKLGFERRVDPRLQRWLSVRSAAVAPPTRETNLLLIETDVSSSNAVPFLVLSVHNLGLEYERLSQAGVRFVEPPEDHGAGNEARFADPDGNVFVLIEEPQ